MIEPNDTLDRLLAFDTFLADGGVDDWESMTDDELKGCVRRYLVAMSEDDDALLWVVNAAKSLRAEQKANTVDVTAEVDERRR